MDNSIFDDRIELFAKRFADALKNGDSFEATKGLGVLEFFNNPHLPYYNGIVMVLQKRYDDAIAFLSGIKPEEENFSQAMRFLEMAYMATGRFSDWKSLVDNGYVKLSPIQQLADCITCILAMDEEQLSTQHDEIEKYDNPVINCIDKSKEGYEELYKLIEQLTFVIDISNSCIKRCADYVMYYPETQISYTNNADLSKYVEIYKKCLLILRISKALTFIQFEEKTASLAKYALADLDWPQKVEQSKTSSHLVDLASSYIELLDPVKYPGLESYPIVICLFDRINSVNSLLLQPLLNKYFDIIEKAAIQGETEAIIYLSIVYADIVALDNDDFVLSDRIKTILTPKEDKEITIGIRKRVLYRSLSGKARFAYENAEQIFSQTNARMYGIRDASSLALMYFRIIEIELNAKLIRPFLRELDLEKIKSLCAYNIDAEKRDEGQDRLYRAWGSNIQIMERANQMNTPSIEIGKIRNLLLDILFKNDVCSSYIGDQLTKHLSYLGTEAFRLQRIMIIIEKSKVDEYRNPGAHTGFLPYSKACEARQFVASALNEMQGWFVATD